MKNNSKAIIWLIIFLIAVAAIAVLIVRMTTNHPMSWDLFYADLKGGFVKEIRINNDTATVIMNGDNPDTSFKEEADRTYTVYIRDEDFQSQLLELASVNDKQPDENAEFVAMSEFENLFNRNKNVLSNINVYRDFFTFEVKEQEDGLEPFKVYTVKVSGESVEKLFSESGFSNFTLRVWKMPTINFNNRYSASLMDYVYIGVLVIGLILLIVFIYRSTINKDRQALSVGKNRANVSNQNVRFSDVAGADEEKEELKEIVEFLKNPQKFEAVGARIPKGVLLVGPPGTGKTLFAKAVAGEAGVPFFNISGSDFVELYVGVGASRVRDLFAQAERSKPCIIFIDEIDAVGRQRGAGLGGGHDEREQTLNQLLVQMDGFKTNEGIIVMAATNRADILDPALLRPGRFDRQIYVNIPDVRGREAIFKVHARNKPLSPEIDFKVLARITSGFSGADIENLLNEASILCAREGRKEIIMEDILEGINKVVMGPQKRSRLVTEVDKRITAYHEAGHALVAKVLPAADPVQEISIIPRGHAAGYTMFRPDDNDHMSLSHLTAQLAVALGGRTAEEIVIQDITAGAQGDIKQVTSIAKKMVTEWGMSDLGPIFYGSEGEVFLGRDYGSQHGYSDAVAEKIDAEIHKIVEQAHKTAQQAIEQHRDKLDVIVRVLVECETIYADEIDMIMAGESVEAVKQVVMGKETRRRKVM